MRHPRLTRAHAHAVASVGAIGVLCVALARPADIAQGSVYPIKETQTNAALSAGTVGIATGGGTVVVSTLPNTIASFGINGKRPPGFTGAGEAQGRINYDKHATVAGGHHVNVPVTFMLLELSASPSVNGTGGQAQLIGDCTITGSECPTGFSSVLVSVQDNSDSGQNDMFQIQYCTGAASSNPALMGCGPVEGGSLRSGQIQIKSSGPSGSQATVPTAARVPLRVP